ncbi:MAG: AAA family ATPase [Bacteroidota bacterium]
MIKKLLIQNYALIEALELEFPSGLTIITGETGAGKSILLGALGLIMGNRADSRSLFDENKKCVVEAYFSIEKYGLASFFENNEIDYEDDLIIRRELTPAGKSRSFINDTPVNLKMLQDLSAELIDLHQQFDTSDIHDQNFQLKMVDALADNAHLLTNYRK